MSEPVQDDQLPSIGPLDLSEGSMTRVGAAPIRDPPPTTCSSMFFDVLRCVVTCSLSLGCRSRSAATRNLGQPDDLSPLALGIGYLRRNVKLNATTLQML